jgi:predicted XRE-type DNA-binding protein
MTDTQWRTWDQIEDEARKAGRLDEARVAAHQERMRAEQRAYRLAEIRKHQGLTQNQIAATMHVSQRRVSAVERGDLSRTELGTIALHARTNWATCCSIPTHCQGTGSKSGKLTNSLPSC